MFFFLSKTIGALTHPLTLSLWLFVVALGLRLIRRLPRLRRGLVWAGALILLVTSLGSVASLLLHPLETAHRRPDRPPRRVGAIVLLCGMTDPHRDTDSYYELTEAGDRLVEAVRLAHRYPGARLVISGGSGALVFDEYREGPTLARLARELGVHRARIVVDGRSRNTHENAVQSARLLGDVEGPVLLVTSAYHMPRAAACFRRQGVAVTAWPVDFRKTGYGPGTWIPRVWSLQRSAKALREYAGWVAYWLADYV